MYSYKIYLGMSKPNGDKVTNEEFFQFVAEEVAPFNQGFTLHSAIGYWEGQQESTRIIEIIAESCEYSFSIARKYKKYFDQEAVLITKTPVEMELI